jgi:tetrahydromethanopterin S-methyltransferase subunit C
MNNNNQEYRNIVKYLVILLLSSITIINLIIITIPDEHNKHTITIITLNATAVITTILGFITVYRYGIKGNHERSYLFLTIGISLWFFADLFILYSYFILGIDEIEQISISDALWLTGYLFLVLHLTLVIRTIKIRSFSKTIGILSMIVILFIIANLLVSIPYNSLAGDNNHHNYNYNRTNSLERYGGLNLILTVLYPILDLSLIVPSAIILLNIYNEYHHLVPLILSTLSLLINAVADNGYTQDYIIGSATYWPWDLFYITDFIIMTGALIWYNVSHNSNNTVYEKRFD